MKRNILFYGVALLMMMFFTTVPALGGEKPTKAVKLTFNWEAAYGPANVCVFPYRPGGRFEQLVTKYTDGLVKLDIKEKLYGIMESIFAIGDGRIDMGTQSVAAATGTYPLFDFGAMPGFFDQPPNGAYQWANAFTSPEMMAIWDKYSIPKGFKILGSTISIAQEGVWGNKAVTTLSAFKGLKIRTSGPTITSTVKAFGGSPVTLSMAEVEDAITRGTVDALVTAISYGSERGLIDLVKYCTLWPFSPAFPQIIAINAKKWETLHPFLKEGLLKAGRQVTHETAMAVEQMEKTYLLWIASSKCQLLRPEKGEVEKAMQRIEPVIQKWMKSSGPLAKDVLRVSLKYATGVSVPLITKIVQ